MKKLLLTIIFTSLIQTSYAQCLTDVTSFGNNTNPNYQVYGDVSLTLNPNNTITLDLASNFQTADGPDVRVFLVNSNGLSDSELASSFISNLDNIPVGLVSCSGCNPQITANGAKTFTVDIPQGKDITNYDRVFFYCYAFNVFWDFGKFTSYTTNNCNILNIEDINKSSKAFNVYPNPASDFITIENTNKSMVNVSVYNIIGKQVLQTKTSSNSKITLHLSSLKPGVYLLKTTSENSNQVTRFVKQ